MIVPMKKVSFVLLEEHRKEALKKLRQLGVVHLEKVNGASEELTAFKDTYSKAETAYAILSASATTSSALARTLFRSKVAVETAFLGSLISDRIA